MSALDILVEDLRESEGYRKNVYDDAVAESSKYRYVSKADCYRSYGQYKVTRTGGTATIGFGETDADLLETWWNTGIPYNDAVALLRNRAADYMGNAVSMVKTPLNPHQQAAIGSLAYNIGLGGFSESTVRRVINEGRLDRETIEYAFHLWDNPDKSLRGRRNAEIERFFTPWEEPNKPNEPKPEPKKEEEDMKILRDDSTGALYMNSGVVVKHIANWDSYVSMVEKGILPGPVGSFISVTSTELNEFILVPNGGTQGITSFEGLRTE